MFRTEVIKTKNYRKSTAYKIFNGFALLVVLTVILLVSGIFGDDSQIGKFLKENYSSIVQPVFYGIALVVFVVSLIFQNSVKSPKRLGSIEIDDDEIRFLVEDEVQETHSIASLQSINFEFFSFRMRGNPMGGMNYLTLQKGSETKTYEIVIANSMVKAEFGDLLRELNKKVPVKISFTYWMKKLMKDKDLNL